MSSSPLYLAIVVVWLIVLVPMLLRRDAADSAPGPGRRTRQGGSVDDDGAAPDDDLDEERGDSEHGGDDYVEHDDALDTDAGPQRTRSPRNNATTTTTATAATAAEGAAESRGNPAQRNGARPGAESDTVAFTHSEPGPAPRRPRVSRARIIARRRRRTSGLVLLLAVTGAAVSMGLGPWWVLTPPALLMLGHLALLREAAKADAERRVADARHRQRLRAEAHVQRTAEAAREAEVIELMTRRNQVYDQYTDAQRRAAGD